MYEILIKSDFSGAHNLKGYRGRCEELHGHNWKIEANFKKDSLDDIGMAVDFKVLRSKLKTIVIMGAKIKTILLEPLGIMFSFVINFKASAKL